MTAMEIAIIAIGAIICLWAVEATVLLERERRKNKVLRGKVAILRRQMHSVQSKGYLNLLHAEQENDQLKRENNIKSSLLRQLERRPS